MKTQEMTNEETRKLILSHMPNKAQHSPLPWTMLSNSIVTVGIPKQGSIAQLGEDDRQGGLHLSREIAEANAKLIVRAVNHAGKLAEALREIIEPLGEDDINDCWQYKEGKQALADYDRSAQNERN